jgi:RNA polymerase sigma factor (sigma-70 family)
MVTDKESQAVGLSLPFGKPKSVPRKAGTWQGLNAAFGTHFSGGFLEFLASFGFGVPTFTNFLRISDEQRGVPPSATTSNSMNDFSLEEPIATMVGTSQETIDQPIDWECQWKTHQRWLATIVRARLADPQAAEDVLQEVALAAVTQKSRPTDPEKVAPWLYRIAVRKVINHHRSKGRRRKLLEGAILAGKGAAEARDPEPGQWLMSKESESAVRNAMKLLESHDRQILLLKYTENWGYQELSEHLGISIKTVEYRLLKARRALRAKIEST